MRRALFVCMALALVACENEETTPEPMLAGSGTAKDGGDDAPAPAGSGAPDPAPKPGSCAPKAGEICLIGADIDHAVVLIHAVTGANIVVVGSYDKRIDGAIAVTSPSAAIDALAQKAELKHKLVGDIHYLGNDEVIGRGAGNAANFCPQQKSMVLQRTPLQDLAKQAVEDGNKHLQGTIRGEITVAASTINACVMVQHLVNMSTGTGRVDAKALRIRGDAELPKATRAAGTPCAPLDTDKVLRQPCHSNTDLAIVGVGKAGDADVALVRRTGRVFEPVEVVKVGEHIGDYHTEVGGIDGGGIKSKTGNAIVTWAP